MELSKTNSSNPSIVSDDTQISVDQNTHKNKMSEVEKIKLWAGIGFMLFAFFVLGFLVIYRIVKPCSIFSSYSHIALCGGGYNFCLLASFFLGIPLNVIGGTFIIRSISSWGRIKHSGAITFLVSILEILFLILLITCIR